MDGLYWKTLLKWMTWGYPYFWKHPYIGPCFFFILRCDPQHNPAFLAEGFNLRPSSVGQAFRALRRGALSWAQVEKNATFFGGHLGHGTIFSWFFCMWDWDTPKSLCDIFHDDMYLKPSLIYQASNFHHLSDLQFPRIYRFCTRNISRPPLGPRSIGRFGKDMKAAGAPIWAVSWLHRLCYSYRPPIKTHARNWPWQWYSFELWGVLMFIFVLGGVYLWNFLWGVAVYKAHTTRIVGDFSLSYDSFEKKVQVGNWKINFHLERPSDSLRGLRPWLKYVDSSLRTCLALNEGRKANKVNKTQQH